MKDKIKLVDKLTGFSYNIVEREGMSFELDVKYDILYDKLPTQTGGITKWIKEIKKVDSNFIGNTVNESPKVIEKPDNGEVNEHKCTCKEQNKELFVLKLATELLKASLPYIELKDSVSDITLELTRKYYEGLISIK